MDNDTNTPRVGKPSTHTIHGVIIGVLIVCLVLVLGGLYLWGSILSENDLNPNLPPVNRELNTEPETPRNDADIQALKTTSNSDELYAIEADLESTNLDTLEAEFTAIDAELGE